MPGDVYWNHNSAYHPWILRYARAVGGHAVDVGAGDGLLAERLAPVVGRVTAVEPDPGARAALAARVGDRSDVLVRPEPFLDLDLPPAGVDVLTLVATLHHLPLVPALLRARELLRPGGLLLVVGLSADHSRRDWAVSAATWPLCRGLSRLHHEHSPEVVVAEPSESLSEIGEVARDLLPAYGSGARSTTATCCAGSDPSDGEGPFDTILPPQATAGHRLRTRRLVRVGGQCRRVRLRWHPCRTPTTS